MFCCPFRADRSASTQLYLNASNLLDGLVRPPPLDIEARYNTGTPEGGLRLLQSLDDLIQDAGDATKRDLDIAVMHQGSAGCAVMSPSSMTVSGQVPTGKISPGAIRSIK